VTKNILDSDKRRVIALQTEVIQREQFFLAGGTGLGVRLRHRVSRDIDWFTAKPFDATRVAQALAALPEKPTDVTVQGAHTLRAYYGSLETSFIRYTQVTARPEVLTAGRLKIPVADMETLALMKAAALHDRGAQRDFVDIHAICAAPGWSVARFIDLATTRLPFAPVQIRLALTYFEDADRLALPIDYSVAWKQVKADLQQGVQQWERSRDRGLER
jgi:hypothetical protein